MEDSVLGLQLRRRHGLASELAAGIRILIKIGV